MMGRLPTATVLTILATTAFAGCTMQQHDGLELVLGTMMPLTGALRNLGQDMQDGAKLAIDEVNAAEAGIHITAHHEDDRTSDTAAAPNTFNLLVSRGVQAIAGPCCSGVTAAILDAAKENEVVISSPSATSPTLTLERDNGGYFWRIPPNDGIQGRVLAQLVHSENVTTANVILINSPYGNGMADVFKTAFQASTPPGVVLKMEKYEEGAVSFSSQVDAVCATPRPDAVVLIAYTEDGGAIIKEMQAKGCLTGMKLFGSEGVYSADDALSKAAGKNPEGAYLTVGMKGSTPESNVTGYQAKFNAKYGHNPNLYSAESYDAVMYVALAALHAGSTQGEDISKSLLDIANGGTKVSSFAEAAQMIKDGQDIDWVGQAHDYDFDSRHEPNTGMYSWWNIKSDGFTEIIARGKSA